MDLEADMFKVYEIKQRVFESNEREAEELRSELKKRKTFLLNLMSSPGAGKTTTLKRTIEVLKDELAIGVMEADIDSDETPRHCRNGVRAIQLHTGGMCPLDAERRQGWTSIGVDGLDSGISRKRGQPRLPRGVRHGFRQKRDDPLRAGRRR